jgi:hypothetical protein
MVKSVAFARFHRAPVASTNVFSDVTWTVVAVAVACVGRSFLRVFSEKAAAARTCIHRRPSMAVSVFVMRVCVCLC